MKFYYFHLMPYVMDHDEPSSWVTLSNRHYDPRIGHQLYHQYLDQLDRASRRLRAPLVQGVTPADERRRIYDDFRSGRTPVLVVSKVGNFAVDLPEASVLVQLSGTFGSRQEEAQRLGRILRPKGDGRGARFYTLVSHETSEEGFAQHRQLFLTEQGYAYEIVGADGLVTDEALPDESEVA